MNVWKDVTWNDIKKRLRADIYFKHFKFFFSREALSIFEQKSSFFNLTFV